MKAKDLMIGDWVKWEYVTYPDVVVNNGYKKVDAIYGDESVDLIDEDTLYEHVPMYDVKVVELTAEILEKNNFEKHFDDDIVIYTHPQGITIEMGINYKLFDDGHFFVRGILHRLYYVHELQHALRLCGIEKEVVI